MLHDADSTTVKFFPQFPFSIESTSQTGIALLRELQRRSLSRYVVRAGLLLLERLEIFRMKNVKPSPFVTRFDHAKSKRSDERPVFVARSALHGSDRVRARIKAGQVAFPRRELPQRLAKDVQQQGVGL